MAMRRLNPQAAAGAAVATPAPSAAPTVYVSAPAAPMTTAPAAVVTAPSAAAPSLPSIFTGALAAIGQLPATLPQTQSAGSNVPYIQFYDHRSPQAVKIQTQNPGVQAGQPFLRMGDTFVPVSNASFVLLRAPFTYYLQLDGGNTWVAAKLEKPAGNANFKEQCAALLMVLPDANGAIDPRLAPAKITFTTLRTVKCGFAYDLVNAAAATQSPEWVQSNPLHGALVQGRVPPLFRVAATMRLIPGTAKATGFSFVTAKAVTATVSPQQCLAIDALLKSEEGQKALREANEAFDADVAEVQRLAAATPK